MLLCSLSFQTMQHITRVCKPNNNKIKPIVNRVTGSGVKVMDIKFEVTRYLIMTVAMELAGTSHNVSLSPLCYIQEREQCCGAD